MPQKDIVASCPPDAKSGIICGGGRGSVMNFLLKSSSYAFVIVLGSLLGLAGSSHAAGSSEGNPGQVATVVAKVSPTVVRIISVQPPNPEDGKSVPAVGSGYIIDPSGFIATNKHVVEDATRGLRGDRRWRALSGVDRRHAGARRTWLCCVFSRITPCRTSSSATATKCGSATRDRDRQPVRASITA